MNNIYQPRVPRQIEEAGRAQTAADFEPPEWNETRYIADAYVNTVRYWQPGAKKKSYDNSEIFAYRILPEVAPVHESESFLPARRSDGSLSSRAIWPVCVIEKFGFDRKISFIPTLPYVPGDGRYEPYGGLYDNPYHLLTSFLWRRKEKRLPKEWAPLVMTTDKITEYRKQHGLWNSFFSTLLLPLPKFRYFSYALLYRGYDVKTECDFEFDGLPYGLGADDGLQVVSVNQQVYGDLKREYARKARTASAGAMDEFYFPDPAAPDQGTINHVWNRSFPNPVDSSAGKQEGFGYAGAVECRYHLSATNFRETDLRLDAAFLDQYYEQWQPWPQMLRGTTGIEQVRLIARYAPELKSPCEQAWERYPVLMTAWEEAFAGAPDSYDFYETLHTIYGMNGSEPPVVPETNATRHRAQTPPPPLPASSPVTTMNDIEEPTAPLREETPMLPRSRTLSPVDVPETIHAATRPRSTPRLLSPLKAIGERNQRGLGDSDLGTPDYEEEFLPSGNGAAF